MASKFFAVVAGVGPGTGRAVALKFAKAYPVVLLARKPESYNDVVAEINKEGGQAIGISADTSDATSVASAFATIKEQLPDKKLAAAIFNVAAGRSLKPFLEQTIDDLNLSLSGNAYVFPPSLPPLSRYPMIMFLDQTLTHVTAAASSTSPKRPSPSFSIPCTTLHTRHPSSLRAPRPHSAGRPSSATSRPASSPSEPWASPWLGSLGPGASMLLTLLSTV